MVRPSGTGMPLIRRLLRPFAYGVAIGPVHSGPARSLTRLSDPAYPSAHLWLLTVKFMGMASAALSQLALKPTPSNEPPAGMAAFQLALVTVAFTPLCEKLPFQVVANVCPLENWYRRVHPLIGVLLRLVIFMLVWNWPGQLL